MLHVQTSETSRLLAKQGIVLRGNVDGHVGVQQGGVKYLHPPQLIVHRVIHPLYQCSSAGRDRHRTLRNIKGPYGNTIPTTGLITTPQLEFVLVTVLLLGLDLGGAVQAAENVFVLVGIITGRDVVVLPTLT